MPKPKPEGKRTGFTTGACAAAAARGAALALIHGRPPAHVETDLPNGSSVLFQIHHGQSDGDRAQAVVIKDAGDDPDRTHGAHLTATVVQLAHQPGLFRLEGGDGVGRVTRPGLGLEVGRAAINPVPCANIEMNVRAACGDWLQRHGISVTISVPGGAVMAEKTLNPRLGILGGISILGISGIVHPYSTSAYRKAMEQGIRAIAAQGERRLVLTTGGRTERFAMAELDDIPEYCFVQMGDFVGAALARAASSGLREVWIGAMVGKLAKIGQGVRNTHAHKSSLDMVRVAELARRVGGSETACLAIAQGVTVRFAAETLREQGLEHAFMEALVQAAWRAVKRELPEEVRVTLLGFDFSGSLLAQESGC
ncbi:MAG: cobalt-precorrin-5B (C(1))-methyltransferase [Magnetococcales bacterium]|nr:cobalt-precorrin-5B (C(1))-methyltransferase [Magnetococcales bacterium]